METPKKALDYLGAQMVEQDMSKTAVRALVGIGVLVGAFVRIYKYRKLLARLAFVLFAAGLLSTGKGALIMEVILQ